MTNAQHIYCCFILSDVIMSYLYLSGGRTSLAFKFPSMTEKPFRTKGKIYTEFRFIKMTIIVFLSMFTQ